MQINPLNRLMSLFVFPQKFTKAHLNASFQSIDLETEMIYKSTSINPSHYTPQTNCALVKAANSKMEEEQNKLNRRVDEKGRKQVSLTIEGVGRVTSLDDVAMICANICGVQLAIVDVPTLKPILYQLAWKIIKFIKNENPTPGCAIIRMRLRIFRWFSWGRSIYFSSYLLHSSRTPSTQTRLNWEVPTWKPSRLQTRSSLRGSSSPKCPVTIKKILPPSTFPHLQRVFLLNLPWTALSTNIAPTTPPNEVPTRSAPLPPKVEGAMSQA
jgi:hypothetical protein